MVGSGRRTLAQDELAKGVTAREAATLSSVVVSSFVTLMPSLKFAAASHLGDELVAVEPSPAFLGGRPNPQRRLSGTILVTTR